MNTKSLGTALKNKIGNATDYLSGKTRVTNAKPILKQPATPFKSTLPKQEVYGVPGVTKKSQLR